MRRPTSTGSDPAALPMRAVIREPAEVGLRRTVGILARVMRLITRRDWRGREKVPQSGPAIFVINHISNIDPLVYGHYITWAGRWPRFLAKAAIFRTPLLGQVARACGQIRVDRDRADGGGAMAQAAAALAAGKSVSIYPEGTITSDPDGWPMIGRTGAARLALETGAPLIPVAQWGAQQILGGKRLIFPRLFPSKQVQVITGDPVLIDDLREAEPSAGTLLLITDRIMDALTSLVAELRQQGPPAERWDPAPAPAGLTTTGGRPVKIAVLGAGAFGTVLALVFADAGHQVRLWGRRADQAAEINSRRTNQRYLPGIELPPIEATVDQQLATDGAEIIVLAVPAQTMRQNLQQWSLPTDAVIVSAAKGLEADTGARMSEVIIDAGVAAERLAVIAGPNLAREMAARLPTAGVVASSSQETAQQVQRALHSPSFRPYTNTDVVGCELAGAAKNPIALAVGMIIGRGLGDNLLGTVMSRGLAEATRLGEALGADPHTFAGLAGTGDLVTTCYSPLSRNRSFGERLGRGMSVTEALAASSGVVEAIPTSGSLAALADEMGVELPIISRIAPVIDGELTADEALDALMSRQVKSER